MAVDHRSLAGEFVALAAAACFGTLAVSGKFAYADGLDVHSLMALRFGLSAIGFAILVALLRRRREAWPEPRTAIRIFALGAVVLATEVTLFFQGLAAPGMTAGLAETVFFIYPVWVVAGSLKRRDPVSRRKLLAAAITAVIGVALTAGSISGGGSGLAPLLAASLLYALYVHWSGAWLAGVDGMVASALMTLGAGVSLTAYGLWQGLETPATAGGWWAVASAVGLGTFAAYGLLYAALGKLPAAEVAVLTTFEPVVAVILGIVLLAEAFGPQQLIGAVLILAGVVYLLGHGSQPGSAD